MQESGPASQGTSSPAPQPRRGSDPVVRWLTLGIAMVIIFWLLSMLSAMFFGIIAPAKAPRTEAERDLLVLSATVQSGKATIQQYAQYVSTLITAGQLNKAQQAINDGLKSAKKDRSYLYAQQANLLYIRKDFKGAAAAADKAMAEAQSELKAYMAENVKANRAPGAGAFMPQSYSDAALTKAQALLAIKDLKGGLAALDLYLKQSPTDSDILVQRGAVKAQLGDKAGAAADYRQALKFIPDYQPALNALKQIGASR